MKPSKPTPNLQLNYCYRDADNNKRHGEIVLAGTVRSLPAYEQRLRQPMESRQFFIASQIGVPEVFLTPKGNRDHCWHSFDGVEETTAAPTDPRTPNQLLAAVAAAEAEGWKDAEPGECYCFGL